MKHSSNPYRALIRKEAVSIAPYASLATVANYLLHGLYKAFHGSEPVLSQQMQTLFNQGVMFLYCGFLVIMGFYMYHRYAEV